MKLKNKIDYYKLISIAIFISLLIIPAIIITIKLVSAETDNVGFKDSVKATFISGNVTNVTNTSFVHYSFKILEQIFSFAGFNYKGNKTTEVLPVLVDTTETSPSPSPSSNETTEPANTNDGRGFLFYLIWFFVIVIVIGSIVFGFYKVYQKQMESKKNTSAFTAWLGVRDETKKALEQYKEKNWTWDYFMQQVLILIKQDAEEIK